MEAFRLLAVFLGFAVHSVASSSPREILWSSRTYGPDGPWQAITFQLGTPAQSIDAYPGGTWGSLLYASDVCTEPKPGPTCYTNDAGLYTPGNSGTATKMGLTVDNDTLGGTNTLIGSGVYFLDDLTLPGTNVFPDIVVPNLSIFAVSDAYRYLPNGTMYSPAVGSLALGAPASNMSFGTTNGALLTGTMHDQGEVPSSSFGLHIGSAATGIPGSYYIGGYDQLRVVGPVSGQAYTQGTFPIDLLDISIGVATGASPFNFTSMSGLLAQGNASLSPSLLVEVESKDPYLYLPESTCQAIAAHLPVSYNSDLGLYIWNTEDTLYQRIVNSPSFLGFTFRANNSVTQNMTINVPFKLLNLNLTEPLAHVGTPYFPCSIPSLDTYRLGRSFLQAAFMSVNWMTNYDGYWFLAQAPGPNIAPAPKVVTIGVDDSMLLPSVNTWVDSWSGYWVPIADDGTQADPNSTTTIPTSSSGSRVNDATSMSTGVKVGIGIAAAAAVLAIIVTVVLLRRRAKRRSRTGEPAKVESHQDMVPPCDHDRDCKSTAELGGASDSIYHNGIVGPSELNAYQISELHGVPYYAEAPSSPISVPFRAELDGSTYASTPTNNHQ